MISLVLRSNGCVKPSSTFLRCFSTKSNKPKSKTSFNLNEKITTTPPQPKPDSNITNNNDKTKNTATETTTTNIDSSKTNKTSTSTTTTTPNSTKFTSTLFNNISKTKSNLNPKFHLVDPPQLLTISSSFIYPEGGMNEYANLSKGTAFLVETPKKLLKKTNNSIYCISCAHITHPFNFPNLYKEDQHEWIYSLAESNIKVELEYRDPKTGKVLHTIPLKPPFHLHPMLDLVVFKVDENDFKRSNVPYTTTIIPLEDYEFPKEGHEGVIFGYQLEDEKENVMKPVEKEYVFHFCESTQRYYVSTKSPTPMGVCGGPVINIENEVVGMVEGLATIDPSMIDKVTDPKRKEFYHKVNNNTVFIPSEELNRFITKIDSTYSIGEELMPE